MSHHNYNKVIKIDSIASPDDVTKEILTSLLNAHYRTKTKNGILHPIDYDDIIQVASFQWQSLGRGVLSNVQLLTVRYSNSNNNNNNTNIAGNSHRPYRKQQQQHKQNIPTQFLAKFRKEEIPLEELFSVEGNFYQLARELTTTSTMMMDGDNDDDDDVTISTNNDHTTRSSSSSSSFPFRLVDAIASGPNWLLFEYVPSDDTDDIVDVHESCPQNRFDGLLLRLARMHAACWMGGAKITTTSSTTATTYPIPLDTTTTYSKSSKEESSYTIASIVKKHAHELSSTPGAGHTLPPSTRQIQFAARWPKVRERLLPYFDSNEGAMSLQQLDEIVHWTSESPRIESIAQSVAERKYTLVHGDFHIGNMLLPKKSSQPIISGKEIREDDVVVESLPTLENKPWLVDWSMAGIGDPCIDLVFFLVVGARSIPTREIVASSSKEEEEEDGVADAGDVSSPCQSTNAITGERVGLILKQYYQALTADNHEGSDAAKEQSHNPSNISSPQAPRVTWETFLTMFRQCLLNQFVILVCYDDLCRSMADASPSGKVYHDHFDRVNVRCARMLLSEYGASCLMNE